MKSKLFLVAAFLLSSVSAWSNTVDTKEIIYNGQRSVEQFALSTEATRTEYEYRDVQRTCYRSVTDYRYECRSEPVRRCTTRPRTCRTVRDRYGNTRRVCSGGGQVCQTEYRRVCRNYPYTRQVPYTCVDRVRTPVQVFDHYVEADVMVRITQDESVANPNELIKFILNGDNFTHQVNGSGNYLVTVNKTQNSQRDGDVERKMIDVNVNIQNAQFLNEYAVASLKNLTVETTSINAVITMSDFDVNKFGVYLQIEKKNLFSRDDMLINRELSANEITVYNSNEGLKVGANLTQLNRELEKGTYEVKLKVFPKAINADNISQFNIQSKELEQRLKVKSNGEVTIK